MADSAPRSRKTSAPGTSTSLEHGDGAWELDLLSGAAHFSDWFYHRLEWPMEVRRKRLADLRPHLAAGSWEALLLAIRTHLERQAPLDAELCVQLQAGEIQWWRMRGSTTHNGRGKPISLTGSMQDISAERHRADPGGAA